MTQLSTLRTLGLALGLGACSSPTAATPAKTGGPAPAVAAASARAPGRLVAIGDVHGDLDALRRALRLAGAIDEKDRWIGGALVVVQTGDVLDRGDDERAMLDLLARLKPEAKAAGGRLVTLNGNHELMNAAGDLRYVTPGTLAAFADMPGDDPRVAHLKPAERPRAAAFLPGGHYAKQLAQSPVVAHIGGTVFVHGGVLPGYVDIERLNQATSAWLRGERPRPPAAISQPDGPVWSRHYSMGVDAEDCDLLARALEGLKAERMVVAHSVHKEGITSACDEQVWRIDTGMAAYYGGPIAVLEIVGSKVKPLSE